MTTSINKPPVWFWVVCVLALIWNGLGVMAYLGRAFATDEMIANMKKRIYNSYRYSKVLWGERYYGGK